MSDISYRTTRRITGSLLFVEDLDGAQYNELVEITFPDGSIVQGQVLDTSKEITIIEPFTETSGLDISNTKIRLTGDSAKLQVSEKMLGRVFDGLGRPKDGGVPIYSDNKLDINGSPINPYAREEPAEFISTGISAIDGMNSLIKGQKLPIFSGSGMPHLKIAAQIIKQASTKSNKGNFYVVFGGIGISSEDANLFINEVGKSKAMNRTIMFINLASESSLERLALPRMALTAAEFLAFQNGADVLVILADMTNYAEALREVSSARDEIPGRRGYPGYMYTDFASIFERAGRVKGKEGSITQIPILTMPLDDITHPIPDLTGYITEGQIVLNRGLTREGIYPNIDVLLSLSRLMDNGVGENQTREDHKQLSNQLYAAYAQGKDLRNLAKIIGEEALSEDDKMYLKFADEFERKFINQDFGENRDITRTLDIGWELLSMLNKKDMKRISEDNIKKYGKWKT